MALSQKLEALKTTLTGLPIAAMATDCSGNVCWTNDCLASLTGYSVKEIVGQNAERLDSDLTAHPLHEILDGIVASGKPWRGESVGKRKNGELYDVERTITPVRDTSNSVTHALWFLQDITGRNRSAAELEHLQGVCRAVQLSAHFGMFQWNAKTRKSQWSPEAYLLYGLDENKTDASLDTWFQTIHAEDQPRILREFQQILDSPDGRLNIEYRSADGLRWIAGTGQLYRDQEGKPDHMVGINIDITERKHAVQSAAEANRDFESFFTLVPDLACIASTDGRFKKVNPAWEAALGYTPEELLRTPFVDLIHPDDIDPKLIAGQMTLQFVNRYRHKDGSYRWLEWRTTPPIGTTLFATARDVTERKRAEEEIHRAAEKVAREESHYRRMFSSGSDSDFVYQLDKDGLPCCFLEVNDNACRTLGYTREQLLRLGPTEIDAPETHREVQAVTQKLLADGRLICEGTQVAKDGRRIPVEFNTRLFELDGSQTVISSVRDITKRKDAEAAKEFLQDQLRQAQKLESVGRLAGGVAHDFNNLLTVINGYSDFLLNYLMPSDPLRPYAEEIKKAGERAAALTRQLLAFSRKQSVQPAVLDLNTTIRESAPMLQRLIGEDIALSTHLDGALGGIMADSDQIHQVIMNLAVNARDAMPGGGTLDIRTMNVDLGVDVTAVHPDARPGQFIVMSVTDNGHGMDERTRQHIFEPFFTTKEVGKGTGLGLSTVYGILRQSGGWIEASSEVGVGSSFKAFLPRVPLSAPLESGIGPAVVGGTETILVVEDQEAVRSFTRAALQQRGYRVLAASGGEEALGMAVQFAGPIHLLLTDVVLPGMNGREIAESLQALRSNLKVLFTSGYTADVIAQHGVLDSGISYISKPFSPDGLAAKVRELLSVAPVGGGADT